MTVIDEHLEFIRMMVRENGVREFLSEKRSEASGRTGFRGCRHF